MSRAAAASQLVLDHLARLGVEPQRTDEGIYLLKYGSTVLMISIFEDDGHAFVRIASTLLVGVRTDLELLTRLLRLNTEVIYGAFLLFEDDTLSFAHTLLADELDAAAFEHALLYVAKLSDDHDEDLQALAGGRRAEEVLSDER